MAADYSSRRIGIDAGEPVAEHNDLFGATVHLAFRLCAEAEADGVVDSGNVRDVCGQDAARFVALGTRRPKGFAERPVFRFEWRHETPPSDCNTVKILGAPLRGLSLPPVGIPARPRERISVGKNGVQRNSLEGLIRLAKQ